MPISAASIPSLKRQAPARSPSEPPSRPPPARAQANFISCAAARATNTPGAPGIASTGRKFGRAAMFDALAGEIVRACQRGALPANVALMRLAMASHSAEQVDRYLSSTESAAALQLLWRHHPNFWALAKAMQATVDHRATINGSVEARARAIARAFDRAASLSPDAASALYGLADPAVLNAATAEVVDYLASLNLLSADARLLDVGCGSGRFEAALAARVGKVVGVEASSAMASAARLRCATLANVEIVVCENGVPPALAEASFDLAIAIDSFPYILQSGAALARRWFDAVGRALTSQGDFVILNFSYSGDLARAAEEAAPVAGRLDLAAIRAGARRFRPRDGREFLLPKRRAP